MARNVSPRWSEATSSTPSAHAFQRFRRYVFLTPLRQVECVTNLVLDRRWKRLQHTKRIAHPHDRLEVPLGHLSLVCHIWHDSVV